LIFKKWPKLFTFRRKCFTKLPKSDVLSKIFVKITQKIQILLDILNKSALLMILSVCLHAVVCDYKTGHGWVPQLSAVTKQVAKLKTFSI